MYDTAAPAVAALAAAESSPVDLYKSGATHQMSPYHAEFLDFTEIAPMSLHIANQQPFQATGIWIRSSPYHKNRSPCRSV